MSEIELRSGEGTAFVARHRGSTGGMHLARPCSDHYLATSELIDSGLGLASAPSDWFSILRTVSTAGAFLIQVASEIARGSFRYLRAWPSNDIAIAVCACLSRYLLEDSMIRIGHHLWEAKRIARGCQTSRGFLAFHYVEKVPAHRIDSRIPL